MGDLHHEKHNERAQPSAQEHERTCESPIPQRWTYACPRSEPESLDRFSSRAPTYMSQYLNVKDVGLLPSPGGSGMACEVRCTRDLGAYVIPTVATE